MPKRLVILFSIFVLFMGMLSVRLITLNMNPTLSQTAAQKTSQSMKIATSRGYFYDCNGKPLVNTTAQQMAILKPNSKTISMVKAAETESKIHFTLKENSLIQAVAVSHPIQNKNMQTVRLVERYSSNPLAVHILGYVNQDNQGVSGLEKIYNDYLQATGGSVVVRCFVNAKGKALEGVPLQIENRNYTSRAGLQLTLDKDLQKITEDILEEFDIQKGAAVLLDAQTAQIKAMASFPTFSPTSPEKSLKNLDAPFLNRAILPYSVGSVFKVVVAAAALEQDIPLNFSVYCSGTESIGKTNFHCHNRHGHGMQTMPQAMANSCNPYFIHLFQKTGKENVCAMGENLGLGAPIELADNFYTKSGIMPTAEELSSPQEEANLAFGQGTLLASPLQMAALYTAFANDGIYRAPSLLVAKIDANQEDFARVFLPTPRRAMSKETAKKVQNLLTYTVENGSCLRAKPEGSTAAGKSGTAQSGSYKENGEEMNHAWFCGWFPSEHPKYVLSIFKEDGKGGSLDCAPIFKAIAEKILEKEKSIKP